MTATRVAAAQDAHLGREPFPEPPDGRLGRLDQQLAAGVAAEVPAEEVEPFAEVDDSRLVLVEGQPPFGQPSRQLVPYVFGLQPAVAADGKVVGLCRLRDYADRLVNVLVRALSSGTGAA